MKTETVDDIIGNIYEAAIEDRRWQGVIQQIREVTDSAYGVMASLGTNRANISVLASECEALKQILLPSSPMLDPYAERQHLVTANQAVLGQDVIDIADYRRTAFFCDYGHRLDTVHLLGSILTRSGKMASSIAWYRGDGDPAYDDRERSFLDRLIPHIQRSLRMSSSLKSAEAASTIAKEVLARLVHAAVLLNHRGKIIHANQRALDLFDQGDGIVCRSDRPQSDDIGDGELLERLLTGLLGVSGQPPTGGTLSIQRRRCRSPLLIQGVPLGQASASAMEKDAKALLLIVDPEQRPIDLPMILHELFDLTAAEAAIAKAIVEGGSPKEIAEHRGVLENTIRTQLKAVLRKTDARSQADLCRLFGSLPIEQSNGD